jgi:hypothetical protein
MTQQEAFEAWAKSQNLDPDHKEKDAWDRDVYSPHIHSMWCGWKAAQAQAATVKESLTVEAADRIPDAGETMEPVGYTNASWLSNPHAGHFSAKKTEWFNVPLYTSPPDAFMNGFEGGKQEARDAAHAEIDSMKAAMRLALEALNNSVDTVWEEYTEAERSYGNYPTRRAKLDGMKAMAQQHDAAIAALEGQLECQ